MTNERELSFDAEAVAAALGWNADLLDHLLEDHKAKSAVREVCAVGGALRSQEPTTAGFERRVMQALHGEGLGAPAQPSPAAPIRPVARSAEGASGLGGVLIASIAATFATFFALLATGAGVGSGPAPVLLAAAAAGVIVAVRELSGQRGGAI